MAQSGTELFIATGGTKMQFMINKEQQLKCVSDELTTQGKVIVNIIEGEIKRPLTGWWQEIRIIWKTADVQPTHAATVPQTKPSIEKVLVTSDNFNSILERIDLFLEDKEWKKAIAYCESALDFDPKNANIYFKYLLADCECSTFEELLNSNKSFEKNQYFQKVLRFGDEKFTAHLNKSILRNEEQKENNRCESVYSQAKSYMSNQLEESYDLICTLLKSIPGYKDTDELLEIYTIKAEEHKRKTIYNKAVKASKSNHIDELKLAITLFDDIKGFKDSNEQTLFCQSRISELKAIAEKERQEQEEKERLEKLKEQQEKEKKAKKEKMIFGIIATILSIVLIYCCVNQFIIIPNNKYEEACALLNNGQYDDAYLILEEIGKLDKIKESKYSRALDLIETNDYETAYNLLIELGNYKDSVDIIEKCNIGIYGADVWDKIKNVHVGDTYIFGTYEQDNNLSNGSEEIEWQVLAKEGTRIFVISKYAIDCKPYNTTYANITWEESSLREWLNNGFIEAAFSKEEQAMIPMVTVSPDEKYDSYGKLNSGTQEKVFLLSKQEAWDYFDSNDERKCQPTDYAISNGARKHDNINCNWWLRSRGYAQNYASVVNFHGEIPNVGSRVKPEEFYEVSIRPVLWIEFDN